MAEYTTLNERFYTVIATELLATTSIKVAEIIKENQKKEKKARAKK